MKSSHSLIGFSTIELLIAFSIGITFLTAALMVVFSDPTTMHSIDSGLTSTLDVTLDNTALSYAKNKLGNILNGLAENSSSYGPTHSRSQGYNTTSTITAISPCVSLVSSETGWSNSIGGRKRQMHFETIISSSSVAATFGHSGCDPVPAGAWDNPEITGPAITPNNFTGSSTDIDTTSINGVPYAVITGIPTGTNLEDLFVINVTDPSRLSIESQTDLSPVGYRRIITVGSIAFASRNETTTHIDIIDLSTPSTPTIITTITLPLAPSALVRSLAYFDEHLFIGTQYLACPPSCSPSQNHEFHIYNVATPRTPYHRGSINIEHNINGITVVDNIAYLATSDNQAELMMVDVSNPSTLLHPDSSGWKYNAPTNLDGTSVYVLGSFAYLGRARATGNAFDFYKVDINNPVFATATKWARLGLTRSNSAVTDIYVQGHTAFVLTSDSQHTFQVWDVIRGSGTSITPLNICQNRLNLPTPAALAYYQDLLLVTNQNQVALTTVHDNPYACVP